MNVDVSHIFAILVPQYSDCAVEYPVLKNLFSLTHSLLIAGN